MIKMGENVKEHNSVGKQFFSHMFSGFEKIWKVKDVLFLIWFIINCVFSVFNT